MVGNSNLTGIIKILTVIGNYGILKQFVSNCSFDLNITDRTFRLLLINFSELTIDF